MKVIGLGLDKQIANSNSALAKRAIFYAANLDEFLFIFPGAGKSLSLTDKVKVWPSGTDNKLLSLLLIYKNLASFLKSGQYQLLTIQDNYFLAVLGVYLAKKYKVKVEIQNHGFEKLTWWRRLLVSWALKRADLVRTVSQRLANFLELEFKIKADKIYIVPVPLDIEALQKAPHNFDLHDKYPGKFIFLTVGRLVKVKNIALQIQALAELKDEQVILLVVGDGPERNNLEKLAQELNLAKQVIFMGWQEQLADYFRTSDCLLLTSFSEGYGMVVAEAVLSQLPVIMTDVGCAGDLLVNNINGLVVPINDLEALLTAMKKMKEDGVFRQSLKEKNINIDYKILSLEQVKEIFNKRWNSLLASK
jgi:glycosyltransferase involved in cell wall biosynthesis